MCQSSDRVGQRVFVISGFLAVFQGICDVVWCAPILGQARCDETKAVKQAAPRPGCLAREFEPAPRRPPPRGGGRRAKWRN